MNLAIEHVTKNTVTIMQSMTFPASFRTVCMESWERMVLEKQR